MKYKINDTIEFKAGSLSYGKIVDYEEESNMYSVELKSGSKIRCTEHYIKGERVVEADEYTKTLLGFSFSNIRCICNIYSCIFYSRYDTQYTTMYTVELANAIYIWIA